jgi:hypothetical protein
LDFFITRQIHLLLFAAFDQFPHNPELAFNTFRILAKISDRQSVRSDLFEKYTSQEIVIRLLQLMNQHRSNIQIISRVSYVIADVAAREPIIPSVAGQLSTPFNISLIPRILVLEEIQAGRNVAPL